MERDGGGREMTKDWIRAIVKINKMGAKQE